MTDRLSDSDLDRADELAAKATPGPWEASPYTRGNPSDGPTLHTIRSVSDADDERCKHQVAETEYDEMGWHDAELIAFARDALPRLVAEVRQSREREAASEWEYTTGHTNPGPHHLTRFSTSQKAAEEQRGREVRNGWEPPTVWRRRPAGPWEAVSPDDQ